MLLYFSTLIDQYCVLLCRFWCHQFSLAWPSVLECQFYCSMCTEWYQCRCVAPGAVAFLRQEPGCASTLMMKMTSWVSSTPNPPVCCGEKWRVGFMNKRSVITRLSTLVYNRLFWVNMSSA